MILNTLNLNQRLSVDDQNKEIERIKNASIGTILFTSSIYSTTDVIETLLYKSGIGYTMHIKDYTVGYCKEA